MAKDSAKDLLGRIGDSFDASSPVRLEVDIDEVDVRDIPAPSPSVSPQEAPSRTRDETLGTRRKGATVGKTDPNVPRETTRFSLDLDRAKHKEFKKFAINEETDASVIGRILVDLLLESDSLKKHVTERLSEMRAAQEE
jgi:hypothetical protein